MDWQALFSKLRVIGMSIFVVLVVAVVGREYWLQVAAQQLRTELQDALRLAPAKASSAECRQAAQLRFRDNVHYDVELRCVDGKSDTLITSGTLPPYISKLPGSSGLVLSPDGWSSLVITAFGRQKEVLVGTQTLEPALAPATVCEGWGFRCCNTEQQVGYGQRPAGVVNNCPGDCRSVCKDKPQVYAFRTDPAFDPQTRTLVLKGSQKTVQFSYVVGDPDGKVVQVVLDYGDQKTEILTQELQTVSHEYRCAQAECLFTASVRVKDNEGNESIPNGISQLFIRVRR